MALLRQALLRATLTAAGAAERPRRQPGAARQRRPHRYEGVMATEPLNHDTHYWNPHGTPSGGLLRKHPDDNARSQFGFPTIPGLIDAARRPFQARGLDIEWYSVFGNHDGLAQGNFPHNLQLTQIATRPLKLLSPPAGVSQGDGVDAVLAGDLPSCSAHWWCCRWPAW